DEIGRLRAVGVCDRRVALVDPALLVVGDLYELLGGWRSPVPARALGPQDLRRVVLGDGGAGGGVLQDGGVGQRDRAGRGVNVVVDEGALLQRHRSVAPDVAGERALADG